MNNAASPANAPLLDRIRSLIEQNGPMPVADYMSLCLADPHHGYYMQADPFGARGDFITAPEVSQVFGELIGAWLVTAWMRSGAPERFHLVELGPGRGTLMGDILRVAALRPAFLSGLTLHFVETSKRLRAVQKETLETRAPKLLRAPVWHDRIDALPDDAPLFVIANEFFDALPIRQYACVGGQWRERCVALDDDSRLCFALGPGLLSKSDLPALPAAPRDGAVLETQPLANALAQTLGQRLSAQGGTALVIDYGYGQSALGDTLQAMRNHAYVPVLDDPGRADLTAHVNFEALARAFRAGGTHAHPLMQQGAFLLAMGLLERAGQLGAGKSGEEQERIRGEVQRLAGPEEMGSLFKVLALGAEDVVLPPFDRQD
jgi:SAM-dependent MidA family methyltransferase